MEGGRRRTKRARTVQIDVRQQNRQLLDPPSAVTELAPYQPILWLLPLAPTFLLRMPVAVGLPPSRQLGLLPFIKSQSSPHVFPSPFLSIGIKRQQPLLFHSILISSPLEPAHQATTLPSSKHSFLEPSHYNIIKLI